MSKPVPAWIRRTITPKQPPGHGQGQKITIARLVAAWSGAFVGIALLAMVVNHFPSLELLVIGSFGASAVLLYAAPGSPFSQPRNLIGGHLVSALTGVACFKYLPDFRTLEVIG